MLGLLGVFGSCCSGHRSIFLFVFAAALVPGITDRTPFFEMIECYCHVVGFGSMVQPSQFVERLRHGRCIGGAIHIELSKNFFETRQIDGLARRHTRQISKFNECIDVLELTTFFVHGVEASEKFGPEIFQQGCHLRLSFSPQRMDRISDLIFERDLGEREKTV